ncbi:amidohydrolase [Janthinobacterium fluminis]|uniref:Amidohydrolase n=1 Tax=Janthinobacterium fluminis TaxID=2987524 RepID=A0ABT5JZB9_9BURK|nr:amidohydrolase [Janthinobacterium fluminis]MDC8758072.1 amidohydrolase [Janthinobacterium fluminis]
MHTQDLNVTLLQTDIAWEAPAENLHRLEQRLNDVGATSLIVLPEMFTTGFTMNPAGVAERMDGPAVAWMRAKAAAKGCDIVGSLVIEDGGRYFNRLVWAKADGGLLHYDKKHLFTFAGEDRHYTAGAAPLIVPVGGWKVATFICYDLRFPAWSRNTDGQYDIALYIASWPERRAKHWQALLQARAIENQAYVIGVNRVGTDGNGVAYSGDSMLIDPLGEVLFHERHKECLHAAALSGARLDEVRSTFPFLKDADRFVLSR